MNSANQTKIAVALFALASFLGLRAVEAADTDLGTIMPLGDSITYGGSGTDAGYRGPLHTLLTGAGMTFEFAGDSTLNPGSLPADQRQHAGHSSYTTYDITNNLDGADYTRFNAFGGEDRDPHGGYWLTGGHDTGRNAIAPDYILLLVGANDFYYNQDANAQANLRELLSTLTTLRPKANVLIADIPPSSYGVTRVDNWNSVVDDEVSYFQGLQKHVTRVDLNTDFPSNGLSADGVHPNDVGYAWMAEQWSDAILAIHAPEPGIATMMIGGLACAVAYVWPKRRTA